MILPQSSKTDCESIHMKNTISSLQASLQSPFPKTHECALPYYTQERAGEKSSDEKPGSFHIYINKLLAK